MARFNLAILLFSFFDEFDRIDTEDLTLACLRSTDLFAEKRTTQLLRRSFAMLAHILVERGVSFPPAHTGKEYHSWSFGEEMEERLF